MESMQEKEIAIIGGGIAGLTAGIYAQKNGYHATIYEMQPYVGGFCTGWYRNGRYLDGCIHWLTGTKEGTQLNRMWKEVGAISSDGKDICYLDSFGSFEYQGDVVTLSADLDKAEKDWITLSPIDKKQIKKFFKMVKDFHKIEEPLHFAINMMPLKDIIKFGLECFKVGSSYLGSMKISCDEYAKKFKHPALRYAISHAQIGDGNLFCMVFTYALFANGNAGIPKGGSKAMAERMKQTFLDLGGSLKLNTKVNKVIIEKDTAKGIELSNGEKIYSDYVLSAMDAKYAYYHLLDEKYLDKSFKKKIDNYKEYPCPSCCLIQLEIEDMVDVNIPLTFEVEPFVVGATTISHLTLRSYAYDKDTYVKDNKTICALLIDQYGEDFEVWNALYQNDKEKYYQTKKELGSAVISRIIKRFPSLENKIKLLDFATPYTMHRYTNATRGAYMTFLFTKRHKMNVEKGYVKGLKNFFVAGQWVQAPGGLPLALASGKFAIQRICKKDRKFYNFTPLKVVKTN